MHDPLGILTNSKQTLPVKKQEDPLGILKKKESGVSTSLSGVSTSTAQLPPKEDESFNKALQNSYNLFMPSQKEEISVVGQVPSYTTPTIDPEDPVKSILGKAKEDYNKKNEEYNLLRSNELFKSGESTRQINSGNKLYYEEQAKQLSKAQKSASEAASKYFTPALTLEENAFKNGLEAKQYLQGKLIKNGKLNPDNETERLAQRKVEQYEKVANSVIEKGLPNAAIDEALNDPASGEHLTKQYKELVGMGMDLPPAVKGLLVANYLSKHSRDLQAFTEEHPAFKDEYDNMRDNLLTIYPEFGTTVVANKISRERQARGLNNKLANFNTTKFNENTDKIAEEILSPKELEVYNSTIKDNKKKYIDTGGFLNRFEEAVESGWHGTTGSIEHLLGGSKMWEDVYSELNKEVTTVNAGAKGLADAFNTLGSFAGTVSYIGAGGNVLRVGGLNPAMANRTMMGLTFMDDFMKQGAAKYPDSPIKATLSGVANTLGLMAASNIFPAKKLNQVFSSIKPEIETAIKDLSVGVTDKQIVKSALSTAFKKGLEPYLKGIGEMAALTQFNQGLDKAFGLDNSAYQHYHPESEMADVVKSMAIGGLLPNALIGIGSYRGKSAMKNFIYESASNPMRMNSAIDMQNIPDEVKQKLKSNIDFLAQSKADLDSRDIPEQEQKSILFRTFREKNLTQQLENTTEPTVKKTIQQEIKNNNEVKETILKGGDEQKVIQRQSADLVKEFYDEDLLKKSHKEMLETAKEEGKEPKLDEKKILPFLKYVAQQVNNITEDGKFNTESDARKSAQKSFPEQIIEAANEAFPDYKKIAEDNDFGLTIDTAPSVLQPDRLRHDIIEPIKTEQDALPISSTGGEVSLPPEGRENIPANSEGMGQGEQGNVPPETRSNEVIPESESKNQGEGEKMRLTHADTEKIYEELGLAGRLETPTKKREQLEKEAQQKLEKGYDFDKVAEDVMNGERSFEDTDQLLFAKKVSDLKKRQEGLDVNSPEFDTLQNQIEKLSRASDVAGTIVGRALQARKNYVPKEESIADFIIREKEVNQGAPLTEQQKETVQKEYTDITKAQNEYNQKIQALQEENARLRAAAEIKKLSSTKSTKKDYAAERKQIFEDIREKLKKARGEINVTPIPYAKELFAIAPDIAKLVRNLYGQGIVKLEEIVKEVHGILKPEIKDITKEDVIDLIAGDYNEKRKDKSELAKNLFDLKTEAQLIKKYESLLRGEEPKSEKKKIQHSQEVESLRKKIKDFQKEKAQAEKDPKEKRSTDEIALSNIKKRTQSQIEQIEQQLKTGDFSKKSKKEPIKLDKEAITLKDKLVKLKQEREVRLLKKEYANRTARQKTVDYTMEVLNVPRTIMSSMDYSAPLRQGIVASISHPRTAGKAFIEMFKQSISQKRFDRWFYDLKEDPRYKLITDSGLAVSDPHDYRLSAKEEAFMNNLAEKIPIVGRFIKGSERAYVGYLNKMRVDLFNRFSERFQEQGKTYENSPELYKKMAEYINNQTGRGKLPKFGDKFDLENAAPFLNTVFFSPRLIASRLNLLNPYYYYKLPKELRIMAAKDMFKFVALGMSVLALAKLNGADVEDDPRSSDFGKIKSGNTRWDIWGGFQQYIRLFTQAALGEKKSTGSGEIQKINGEGRFGESRADVLGRFGRGKLAPVPSMIMDFLSTRTVSGDPVTVGGEAESHLLPLLYSDIKDAYKEQGIKSLFTVGVPASLGVGIQTFTPTQTSSTPRKKRSQRIADRKKKKSKKE